MTPLERLFRWKAAGALSDTQFDSIAAVVRKERFPVFLELNTLLYLGVVSLVGGVGWVIQTYVSTLGDAAILFGLTAILLGSLYYCFSRTPPFSPAQVESPSFAFDYVLYLGCLTLAVELGYIEFRFQIMQAEWDYYLLASAFVFFLLAYRFDNRFVLSLALSTLAAWFGLRISRLGFYTGETLRRSGVAYGALVIVAALMLYRRGVKKHFTDTYVDIGAFVLFTSMLTGVFQDESLFYLAGTIGLAAVAIPGGIRFNRFLFVVYGIIFSYIAISYQFLHGISWDSSGALLYLVLSGCLVVVLTIGLARRLGRAQ
jgi:hypothetical protein